MAAPPHFSLHTNPWYAAPYRHIHQDVRGSSHHVWLSVVCKWVLGFPASAQSSCQNRKTALYGEIFHVAPIRARRQGFFNIPKGVCMSQKMNLVERYIQCSGICVTLRTGFQSDSQLWHDFQVQAVQIWLKYSTDLFFFYFIFMYLEVKWTKVDKEHQFANFSENWCHYLSF